ncbi:hypothetical protein ACSTJ4_23795, partial [Vibrio parahaemolyticus]
QVHGQYYMMFGQVFWAIGASMMVLGVLVWLPREVILAFALLVVVGHNFVDGTKPEQFGNLAGVWNVLHVPGQVWLADHLVMFTAYPLVP